MIRRLGLVGVGVAVLVGLSAPSSAQFLNPQPDGAGQGLLPSGPVLTAGGTMSFPVSEYNFGDIDDSDKVSCVFPFTNSGVGVLTIENMRGSCGCTVAELDKREYLPGESGEIRVEFNPNNKKGQVKQSITVSTNDPESPMSMLYIKANVKKLVFTDPANIQLKEVERGAGAKETVRVIGRNPKFEVTHVSVNEVFMTAKIVGARDVLDGTDTAREVTVELELSPDAPLGRISKILTIRTNDERRELVNVAINGDVVGDLKVLPNRLPMGTLKTEREFSREIRLSSRKAKGFRILSVEVEVGEGQSPLPIKFEVSPEPDLPHLSYRIQVSGTAPDEAGFLRGDLVIKTDVEDEEEVRIPIMATIRE